MTARIDQFKSSVTASIKQRLPQLKTCHAIGGRFNMDNLLEKSIRPPAVLFAILRSPIDIKPNRQVALNSQCAAYIITEGRESDRDGSAWVVAEAIAKMLGDDGLWQSIKIGLPEKAEIEPLISADFRKRGITLIAVKWSQKINRLGESIFAEDGTVYDTLYVNGDEVELPDPEAV